MLGATTEDTLLGVATSLPCLEPNIIAKIRPARASRPKRAHNQQGHPLVYFSWAGGGGTLILDERMDCPPQLGPLTV